MTTSRSGGILSSLALFILLVLAAGYFWLWSQGKTNMVSDQLMGKPKKELSYVPYDEHLRKKENEKKMAAWKQQVSGWFNKK